MLKIYFRVIQPVMIWAMRVLMRVPRDCGCSDTDYRPLPYRRDWLSGLWDVLPSRGMINRRRAGDCGWSAMQSWYLVDDDDYSVYLLWIKGAKWWQVFRVIANLHYICTNENNLPFDADQYLDDCGFGKSVGIYRVPLKRAKCDCDWEIKNPLKKIREEFSELGDAFNDEMGDE